MYGGRSHFYLRDSLLGHQTLLGSLGFGEKMPGSQGVGDAKFDGFRVMALGFLLAEWPLVMCAWEFGLTLRKAFRDLGDWV